jgi:hypothetical protein
VALPSGTLDVEVAHQSGDLVTADVVAGTLGCNPQFAGPIDAEVVDEQLQQNDFHQRVGQGTR